MSASNWDTCPRCWKRAKNKADRVLADVMNLYGKIPVEEFDELRANLFSPTPEDFKTFREDYEIVGAHLGYVKVTYSGACAWCGLELNFTHTHEIEI